MICQKHQRPQHGNSLLKDIKPTQAKDVVFVKPSHSDINEVEAVKSIQRNQFDNGTYSYFHIVNMSQKSKQALMDVDILLHRNL